MAETRASAAEQRMREQILTAIAARQALHIVGGASKTFLAQDHDAETLPTETLNGIVSYEPSELVVTAQAGTPLATINQALEASGQMLGFEPPQLAPVTTIGGVIASGFSGPARPFRGSARDFVLGLRLLDGHGEVLRFGGEVMKNVAGYDIARLATGAFGSLGVITEVSLRLLPRPQAELTISAELDRENALALLRQIPGTNWPVSAAAFDGSKIRVRLSGAEEAVSAAAKALPGETDDAGDDFWRSLRDITHADLAVSAGQTLWRLSLPPAAADSAEFPVSIYDWGGAQRWVRGEFDSASVQDYCRQQGGHAACFRRGPQAPAQVLHAPRAPAIAAIEQRLKDVFDPHRIFNPGIYVSGL